MIRLALFFLLLPAWAFAQDSLSRGLAYDYLETIRDTIIYHHEVGQNEAGKEALLTAAERGNSILNEWASADSVGLQDFIIAASELQSVAYCGHLQLYPKRGKAYLKRHDYPKRTFGVLLAPDGTYRLTDTLLITATPDSLLTPGTQITSLDGKEIPGLVKDLAVFRGMNDGGYNGATEYRTALRLSALYGSRYGWRDTLSLTYVEEGQRRPVTTSFVTRIAQDSTKVGTDAAQSPSKRQLRRTRYLRNWSFGPSELDSSVYVMAVRSFSTDNYRKVGFQKLLRNAFAELKDKGIKRLIVDVRGNGGGSVLAANKLAIYLSHEPISLVSDTYGRSPTANGSNWFDNYGLWLAGMRKRDGVYRLKRVTKPQKSNKLVFDGEVAIIMNEYSFSATTLFANALMEQDVATSYGRRTGGSRAVTYGNAKQYVIGDKGDIQFTLFVPDLAFVPINPGEGTITPDVVVPRTTEALIEGRDEAIEQAIEDFE